MTILLHRRDDDSVILQYLSGMWSSCYRGMEIGHISFMQINIIILVNLSGPPCNHRRYVLI